VTASQTEMSKNYHPPDVHPLWDQNFTVNLALVLFKNQEIPEGDESAVRTLMKILITMMRPSRNGKRGARTATTTKNARNMDHGRLLQRCEKV